MTRRQTESTTIRVSLADWLVDDGSDDEPKHAVSVVAARCGVRVSTLRRYEDWGLVEPRRSGQRRLYSDSDIDRILRVRRLIDDLGLNLAGAAAVLHLRQQVIALQREMEMLREQLGR
jgi:MerR family transcriptional regulator/heat shock protein HspR